MCLNGIDAWECLSFLYFLNSRGDDNPVIDDLAGLFKGPVPFEFALGGDGGHGLAEVVVIRLGLFFIPYPHFHHGTGEGLGIGVDEDALEFAPLEVDIVQTQGLGQGQIPLLEVLSGVQTSPMTSVGVVL